jgi:hypothetical protein
MDFKSIASASSATAPTTKQFYSIIKKWQVGLANRFYFVFWQA